MGGVSDSGGFVLPADDDMNSRETTPRYMQPDNETGNVETDQSIDERDPWAKQPTST